MKGMTSNLCQAARYLSADGWSTERIAACFEVDQKSVLFHINGECRCPDDVDPTPYETVSGDDLRQRREEAGITLTELAGELGVAKATVSKWERGETEPRSWRGPEIERALSGGVS